MTTALYFRVSNKDREAAEEQFRKVVEFYVHQFVKEGAEPTVTAIRNTIQMLKNGIDNLVARMILLDTQRMYLDVYGAGVLPSRAAWKRLQEDIARGPEIGITRVIIADTGVLGAGSDAIQAMHRIKNLGVELVSVRLEKRLAGL